MPPSPNARFEGVVPVAHGALDPGELAGLGLSPDEVVDFSANVNPYGPAPEVLEAARSADISRYPDRECRELVADISAHVEVEPSSVVAGNGSADLIDGLARCYLGPGDAALVVGPTFGEYERASRLSGARVLGFDRKVTARGADLDLDGLLETVFRERPRLVWLCDPNNPTGDYLGREGIEGLLGAVVETDGLLVVDEAYRDLMLGREPDDLAYLLPGGNLIFLRSMTKSHALAGLRLGYALSHPEVARVLASVQPPWSVNAPAQAAGVAALSASALEHVRRSRERMAREAAYLRRELARLGLPVLPGVCAFLLVAVGSGAAVRSRLLEDGIQVRDCASFGLPEYVRVSVRRREECERLAAALGRVVEERG